LNVSFSNESNDAGSFQWTFDLGDPGTGVGPESTAESPSWTYSGFGSFTAQLIAQPGEACADTSTATVNVLPEDPLVMSFSAIEPLACSMETTVDFVFNGANADAVEWDFGSAGSATGDSVTYDFGTSGLFSVNLTIENDECGTQQTSVFEVYVPELVSEVELVIPNVLTPNADGKNDRFRVGTRRVDDNGVIPTNTASFSQFRLQVFDRWGVLIHESEGVGAGWDGRIGGTVAAPGTYYYILNADHSCLDADIVETGELTLIVD
jgi:gliding motility-associated-like protein